MPAKLKVVPIKRFRDRRHRELIAATIRRGVQTGEICDLTVVWRERGKNGISINTSRNIRDAVYDLEKAKSILLDTDVG